jgi:predicted dehydrogenase
MQHFVNCALGKEQPVETGEDGREVLKIILAAYHSAGAEAARRVKRFHMEMQDYRLELRSC